MSFLIHLFSLLNEKDKAKQNKMIYVQYEYSYVFVIYILLVSLDRHFEDLDRYYQDVCCSVNYKDQYKIGNIYIGNDECVIDGVR